MLSGLLGILLSALFGALILHFSVKIAAGDVARDVTFGRAFYVNVVLLVLVVVLHWIPIVGGLLALIATFWVVMSAYKIGFLRSLLVWFVYWLIMLLLGFVFVVQLGLAAGLLAMF